MWGLSHRPHEMHSRVCLKGKPFIPQHHFISWVAVSFLSVGCPSLILTGLWWLISTVSLAGLWLSTEAHLEARLWWYFRAVQLQREDPSWIWDGIIWQAHTWTSHGPRRDQRGSQLTTYIHSASWLWKWYNSHRKLPPSSLPYHDEHIPWNHELRQILHSQHAFITVIQRPFHSSSVFSAPQTDLAISNKPK